jgi:hypothetical protein
MPALSFKHLLSIVISILIIFILFLTAWRLPAVGSALGLIFLSFGLAATGFSIVHKNRKACRQGRISPSTAIKNTLLELAAVLLTLVLAGMAGRALSGVLAGNIHSQPVKLVSVIGMGLLAGWAIGLAIKSVSGRFVKIPPAGG